MSSLEKIGNEGERRRAFHELISEIKGTPLLKDNLTPILDALDKIEETLQKYYSELERIFI